MIITTSKNYYLIITFKNIPEFAAVQYRNLIHLEMNAIEKQLKNSFYYNGLSLEELSTDKTRTPPRNKYKLIINLEKISYSDLFTVRGCVQQTINFIVNKKLYKIPEIYYRTQKYYDIWKN